jgi:trans-aconitate 2-methyltransferase
MSWDPAQYSLYATPRLRPALDLLGRIDATGIGLAADLGCGTGQLAGLLAARWPKAQVYGIDSSAEMLARADRSGPVRWVRADIGDWVPPQPADLLFSNAALHWLDDHDIVFPRLMEMLAPGGWLAVQMPRNHGAPSHTCLSRAALSGPWRERLEPRLRTRPVAAPETYYDVLAPLSAALDIWETEYLHVLDGADPVLRWTESTALRPLTAALEDRPDWRTDFTETYRQCLAAAYPPRADGKTLFPFRRLFLIARKG